MGNKLVVTVIPNWNLKDDLRECLDSLQQCTYHPHQVVVVDNGSTDGSPTVVAEHYPWVHLIPLPDNRGYAAALNVGIEYALTLAADYVLALNNDTVVLTDTITRLVALLAADQSIGIAAPKVLYYDHPDRIYRLGDRMYRWLPLPVGFGPRWRDHPRFARVMDFDYVSGCAMLIRTTLFREIGLFNPTFFMYYEDADFCRRARRRGYRIVCDGRAVMYHKASLSAKKDKVGILRIRARNRMYFYRKYPHGPHPWFTYVFLALIAVWRVAGYLIRGQQQLILPYLQGLWAGWRQQPAPDEC